MKTECVERLLIGPKIVGFIKTCVDAIARRPVQVQAYVNVELMSRRNELVDTVNKFIASSDDVERANLMKQYQKVVTANLDTIGLTEYPGALIINKRFANIPVGAPIFMFNWAEDNIIRERVFVPADKQSDFELHKETLVNKAGEKNPLE